MILRNLLPLFIFVVLIGCNQTDSSTESQSTDPKNSQSQANPSTVSENEYKEDSKGKILALINNSPIYEDDLNSGSLEYAITDEILYQIGIKRGIEEQYKDQVKEYEKTIVVRAIKIDMLENAEPTKSISEEEIQDHYDRNKDRYTNFRIHEISFSDASVGQEIKEKAESGMDLIEIADSYPDIGISVIDIGYNREMGLKFSNKEVGSISDVIQKPDGTFSVLKIIEMKEVPLKVSKNSIRHILGSRRQAQLLHINVIKMAEDNDIKVEYVK
jgi:hypothetical protein